MFHYTVRKFLLIIIIGCCFEVCLAEPKKYKFHLAEQSHLLPFMQSRSNMKAVSLSRSLIRKNSAPQFPLQNLIFASRRRSVLRRGPHMPGLLQPEHRQRDGGTVENSHTLILCLSLLNGIKWLRWPINKEPAKTMVGGYGQLGGCRSRDGRMEPGSGCHELCMNIYNLSYLVLALTLYWGSLIWLIRSSRMLDNTVINVFYSKFRQFMLILVDEV